MGHSASGSDLEDADEPVSKRESVAEVCRFSGKVSGQPDPGNVAIGAGSLPAQQLDRVSIFGGWALPPPADLGSSAPCASFIRYLRVVCKTSDDRAGVSRVSGLHVGGYFGGEVEARANEIDSLAAHGDALAEEQSALTLSLGDAPVGANDALPRKCLLRGRQHPPDQARRLRVDLAIGTNRTLGNLPNPGDDAGNARLVAGRRDSVGLQLRPAPSVAITMHSGPGG